MFQILSSKSSITFIFLLIACALGILGYAELNLAPFAWEFKNFLIGQNLNHGFRLYQDIRDNTGPLTANFSKYLIFLHLHLLECAYCFFDRRFSGLCVPTNHSPLRPHAPLAICHFSFTSHFSQLF